MRLVPLLVAVLVLAGCATRPPAEAEAPLPPPAPTPHDGSYRGRMLVQRDFSGRCPAAADRQVTVVNNRFSLTYGGDSATQWHPDVAADGGVDSIGSDGVTRLVGRFADGGFRGVLRNQACDHALELQREPPVLASHRPAPHRAAPPNPRNSSHAALPLPPPPAPAAAGRARPRPGARVAQHQHARPRR